MGGATFVQRLANSLPFSQEIGQDAAGETEDYKLAQQLAKGDPEEEHAKIHLGDPCDQRQRITDEGDPGEKESDRSPTLEKAFSPHQGFRLHREVARQDKFAPLFAHIVVGDRTEDAAAGGGEDDQPDVEPHGIDGNNGRFGGQRNERSGEIADQKDAQVAKLFDE